MKYGFLGPEGTFTEAALLQVLPEGAKAIALPTVDSALQAVRDGGVYASVVPLENSVEGGVSATLDALASGTPLVMQREVLIPITFVLAVRPGTNLADIRRVGSHPHAWAQCRNWAAANIPKAEHVPSLSTAAAASALAAGDALWQAALCSPHAAAKWGLEVLTADVGDNPAAITRFILVAQPGELPAPTGADKTSLVVFQNEDHPGGLLEMLEHFSTRGINLTRIESRPTGEFLGQYSFSIDCEGHVAEARVAEALMGLHRSCAQVRFLGSYPRADPRPAMTTPATSDAAFENAAQWLAHIRSGNSGN